MKVAAQFLSSRRSCRYVALIAATALFSVSTVSAFAQSAVATELEEVEKLKAAEYQDYMSAMSFEDNNQKLGNYYLHKGAEVHHEIDEIEAGHPVSKAETDQALDTSNAENYDNRPPVPLEDEIGNGY